MSQSVFDMGSENRETLFSKRVIRLSRTDNVAVAADGLQAGDSIDSGKTLAKESIPPGHKVAVCDINAGTAVFKYGQAIGFAIRDIATGRHVHDHNLCVGSVPRDYATGQDLRPPVLVPVNERARFNGIVRSDGRTATRNFVGVLASVSCSSSVSRFTADAVKNDIAEHYPNVDGIIALGHGGGCCHSPESEGLVYLQRVLAGYARHPNFGAIVLVGLGCEVNHLECLFETTGLHAGPRLRTVDIQKAGGTSAAVKAGVTAIREMLPAVNDAQRQPVTADKIVLGLECGGSDAYSGISANPALGAAVDLLVANGGTAILSETPEIYGAEHLLTRRAADVKTADVG